MYSTKSHPGKVIPVVDSVYKFDDALIAYNRIMTGHARGKVVIVMDSDVYLESRLLPS
jgi:NADPH:quinone reductase-like Zn-dependent oxidoreductase